MPPALLGWFIRKQCTSVLLVEQYLTLAEASLYILSIVFPLGSLAALCGSVSTVSRVRIVQFIVAAFQPTQL